jgi:hypothetical protein
VRSAFEQVQAQWEEGRRRLAAADPAVRPALERVTDQIVDEIRRRIGASFTAEQLAQMYLDHGTDWCFEIATRAAPSQPEAWDLATVAGAAFAQYLRQARDFGGGRRLLDPDEESSV